MPDARSGEAAKNSARLPLRASDCARRADSPAGRMTTASRPGFVTRWGRACRRARAPASLVGIAFLTTLVRTYRRCILLSGRHQRRSKVESENRGSPAAGWLASSEAPPKPANLLLRRSRSRGRSRGTGRRRSRSAVLLHSRLGAVLLAVLFHGGSGRSLSSAGGRLGRGRSLGGKCHAGACQGDRHQSRFHFLFSPLRAVSMSPAHNPIMR